VGIRSPEPSCNDLTHELCGAPPPDLDAGHPALQHPPLQALCEDHVASLILFTPVLVGRSYPCSQNANTGAPPPLLHHGHAPAALHSTALTRFRVTLALRTHTHPFAQFPCPELRANALTGEPAAADPSPQLCPLPRAPVSPALGLGGLCMSRSPSLTQTPIELTPGRPSSAISGEFPVTRRRVNPVPATCAAVPAREQIRSAGSETNAPD
jgi:hypothetical protein